MHPPTPHQEDPVPPVHSQRHAWPKDWELLSQMVFEKTLETKCIICKFSKIIVFSLLKINLQNLSKLPKWGLWTACSEAVGILVSRLQKPSNGRNPKSGQQEVPWCQAKGFGVNFADGKTYWQFWGEKWLNESISWRKNKLESMQQMTEKEPEDAGPKEPSYRSAFPPLCFWLL